MKTYRDLIVWQKGMDLVEDTYKLTKHFPAEELYCLTQQVRRCVISIPSNIAEGYGRNHTKDYIRFLQISSGSLYELQTQIEIALRLEYIVKEDFDKVNNLSIEIEKMLSSLIYKLKQSSK
ncbi:four helix bundle protein [Carboxylicivirga linearis]|uniref:Four helix bundle protein n=1 Tax=Carboxylicivirga linearis TaxID=1628157 RepID=A0ABS5JQK7_9BACT|nr:four helix bundle protein [Carboxylicivirga linearis]MBS2097161.1 four helix bundle protein [Carboxylicivirga linearis]